jgi:hypothetical protein
MGVRLCGWAMAALLGAACVHPVPLGPELGSTHAPYTGLPWYFVNLHRPELPLAVVRSLDPAARERAELLLTALDARASVLGERTTPTEAEALAAEARELDQLAQAIPGASTYADAILRLAEAVPSLPPDTLPTVSSRLAVLVAEVRSRLHA